MGKNDSAVGSSLPQITANQPWMKTWNGSENKKKIKEHLRFRSFCTPFSEDAREEDHKQQLAESGLLQENTVITILSIKSSTPPKLQDHEY